MDSRCNPEFHFYFYFLGKTCKKVNNGMETPKYDGMQKYQKSSSFKRDRWKMKRKRKEIGKGERKKRKKEKS